MTAPRLDLAPLELTPQVYWQPGEQERLASTESARYFSTESLAERMEQKVDELYYRNWVLGMMYGCF